MWKIFQVSIFLGVVFVGIHYEWTPNGYVLGFVAWLVTYGATVLLYSLLLKLRSLLSHQRAHYRLTARR